MREYYRLIFAFVQHHKYSIEDIENLIPFEREIYATMLKQHVDTVEKEMADQKAKINIVSYLAEWCPNCHYEAIALRDLYRKFSKLSIEMAVVMNYSEIKNSMSFVKSYRLKMNIFYGELIEKQEDSLDKLLFTQFRKKNNDLRKWGTTFHIKIKNENLKRNSPACIIYTSGTAGNPKGVILSHGGILNNLEGAQEILKPLINKKPIFLTWLPLSHSYEHAVQFVQIAVGAKVFYAEKIEKLLENISQAKPTIMTAVPRFYQNLYNKINMNMKKATGLKATLIKLTINLGKKKLLGEKMNISI